MAGRPIGVAGDDVTDTVISVTEFGQVYTLQGATTYRGEEDKEVNAPATKRPRTNEGDAMDIAD